MKKIFGKLSSWFERKPKEEVALIAEDFGSEDPKEKVVIKQQSELTGLGKFLKGIWKVIKLTIIVIVIVCAAVGAAGFYQVIVG